MKRTSQEAAIAIVTELGATRASTGLSLLFASGERPSASDVERLLQHPSAALAAARISHDPGAGAGWLEILASGLTFDLSGLGPGPAETAPQARHFFGLPETADHFHFEAVRLAAGQHLAGGASMVPLVRVMLAIALAFTELPALRAVSWHPAATWIDPGYFGRIMANWLAGGPFPVLGLAAMAREPGGAVRSEGLRFFTGQEVRVEGHKGETTAETVKLAVRAADLLVRAGRLEEPQELTGPEGTRLLAAPSADGETVELRRMA